MVVSAPPELARRPFAFLRVRDPENQLKGGSNLRDCIVYEDGTVIRSAGIPLKTIQGKLTRPVAALRAELSKQLAGQPTSVSLTRRRHQPSLTILLHTDKGWIVSGAYGVTPEGAPSSMEDSKPVPTQLVAAIAALRTLEIEEPRAFIPRDAQLILQRAQGCEVGVGWPKLVPAPTQNIGPDEDRLHYAIDLRRLPAVSQFQKSLRDNECASLEERKWTMRGRAIYPGEDYLDTVDDALASAWDAALRSR